MARNMITGIETQKMQEYTQEQIDRAEHMGIAIPADVKEQIFEYANLVGEEEKVRTLGSISYQHGNWCSGGFAFKNTGQNLHGIVFLSRCGKFALPRFPTV